MNAESFKRSENVVLRDMAGEHYLIVLDAGESKMFNLNDMGLWFWNKLADSRTKAQLLSDMLDEYDVDQNTAAAEIDRFLSYLQERALITASE